MKVCHRSMKVKTEGDLHWSAQFGSVSKWNVGCVPQITKILIVETLVWFWDSDSKEQWPWEQRLRVPTAESAFCGSCLSAHDASLAEKKVLWKPFLQLLTFSGPCTVCYLICTVAFRGFLWLFMGGHSGWTCWPEERIGDVFPLCVYFC